MKNKKGFTLIELILVVVLLGIIGAAFAAGLVPTMQASVMVDNRKEAIQSARMAMDRMVKEIRLIRSNTATDIPICLGNDLQFNDAINNNSIRFRLSGASLLRNADTLSANVQSLSFTYCDKNHNSQCTAPTAQLPAQNPCTTTAASLWRIKISLTVQVGGSETVVLQSEVNPGNFT